MKKGPPSLRFIAYLQLLVPGVKWLILSELPNFATFSLGFLLFASTFFLKKFSIVAFAVTSLTLISLGIERTIQEQTLGTQLTLGVDVLNSGICGYWLWKVTQAAFLRTSLRWWWDGAPRYRIKIPATLKWNNETREANILDLSEDGALVDLGKTRKLMPGDLIQLNWSFYHLHFEVRGVAVHTLGDAGNFAGIEFQSLTKAQKSELSRLVRAFVLLRIDFRPTRPNLEKVPPTLKNASHHHLLKVPPPPPSETTENTKKAA